MLNGLTANSSPAEIVTSFVSYMREIMKAVDQIKGVTLQLLSLRPPTFRPTTITDSFESLCSASVKHQKDLQQILKLLKGIVRGKSHYDNGLLSPSIYKYVPLKDKDPTWKSRLSAASLDQPRRRLESCDFQDNGESDVKQSEDQSGSIDGKKKYRMRKSNRLCLTIIGKIREELGVPDLSEDSPYL